MKRYWCVFFVACVLVFVFSPEKGGNDTAPEIVRKSVRVSAPVPRRVFSAPKPVRFQETEFYRTIIDNNLFRSLGWQKPVPRDPYQLLGTLVSGATEGVWVSKAVISVGGEVRILGIGDALDGKTRVLGIDRHSAVLEQGGKERVLRLSVSSVFLKGNR